MNDIYLLKQGLPPLSINQPTKQITSQYSLSNATSTKTLEKACFSITLHDKRMNQTYAKIFICTTLSTV